MSEYADRDIIAQGSYYLRHVSAMTAERLHEKSDIAAELAHRDQEIDRLRAERGALLGGDPLATAYRMGYAQAQDEARLDQKFCPHCNPCRRAAEITKAETERDAARALLREARQELPPTVEANQPEWADMLARIDAALREGKA